jgi:DNA-binding response OmpR family regulator
MDTNAEAMTTILVVEDDPSVAELVRAVLNDVSGWGAIVAYDAYTAMSMLERVPADVLVLDINLPGMSGIDLLAHLRRSRAWHDPPVIMMSANVSEARVAEALGTDGFLQFIAKPFDLDDLVDAVAAAAHCVQRTTPWRAALRRTPMRRVPACAAPAASREPARPQADRRLEWQVVS